MKEIERFFMICNVTFRKRGYTHQKRKSFVGCLDLANLQSFKVSPTRFELISSEPESDILSIELRGQKYKMLLHHFVA